MHICNDDAFKRIIDKNKIPICRILGVDIAAINMEWLLDFISENINKLSGDYITVSNVHTTVIAYKDPSYCMVQNGSVMSIPDGGPLSTLGKKRGYTNMERVTGPDLMEEIFKVSVSRKYKHYFYGSTNDTLKKLHKRLTYLYPGILIVGMYSPPYRKLDKKEDIAVIEKINKSKADFVWVGLGAPKQEEWMARHQGKIHGLMIGVGAGFDYHAGNIKRAPDWMQRSNLEWCYRLIQDPRRLFGRYLHTNITFILEAMVKGR